MSVKAKLICYGGVGSVTGANFLLETENKKFLVDCGLVQGGRENMKLNYNDFEYNPSEIDILFVTHSHIDHIGRIPKLVKYGFDGKIISTPATKDIAGLMFDDAIKIMNYEYQKYGTVPLYEPENAKKAISLWETVDYHDIYDADPFNVIYKDAGHILGSGMISFTPKDGGKTFTFTGDLGNTPTPLLRDTESLERTNILLTESVYGDRNHETKGQRDNKLKEILERTIKRGGTVMIPAFSLERTQIVLYKINNLVEDKIIPSVPVFLDSPLAIKVTEVYRRYQSRFNNDIKEEIKEGDDIFQFPKLEMVSDVKDSREIHGVSGPKIIIAGSGMSAGGRIQSHEKKYLGDKKNTLLLVGYQAVGTLGRKLQDGLKRLKIDDDYVRVRADVENILGYSSHKDSDSIMDLISTAESTLEKVFTAMGEPKSSLHLAQRIKDEFGINAIYPKRGKVYELEL